MTEHQRYAVHLLTQAGLTVNEIAQAMSLPVEQVLEALKRGRR